jgi:hypothetical protein
MEPCLEAACELVVVERRQGKSSDLQPIAKEVIGQLRPDAFASPGLLLGLQNLFARRWFTNSEC